MGRSGQVSQGLWGRSHMHLHIGGAKLLRVLLDEGCRRGLFLDGVHFAVRGCQRHLDGDGAGSRADVPGNRIPVQIQLGHGETAHLALRHGRVAPLKLFVGDAASKSTCVGRVFDDSHAEAVKGFLLQLRGSALGDTLLRVVEAFADVELHVFESIFFQFFA